MRKLKKINCNGVNAIVFNAKKRFRLHPRFKNRGFRLRFAIRQESVKRRKNFLPTLVLTVILLLITIGFIYFVDPFVKFAVFLFFILIFSSLLFLFSVIVGNSRRGLISSSGTTLFLLLRYLGVGNILNLLIIIGLCIVTEYYFGNKIK